MTANELYRENQELLEAIRDALIAAQEGDLEEVVEILTDCVDDEDD